MSGAENLEAFHVMFGIGTVDLRCGVEGLRRMWDRIDKTKNYIFYGICKCFNKKSPTV